MAYQVFTDYSQSSVTQAVTALSSYPKTDTVKMQVTIQPSAASGATSGTVALGYKARGSNNFEALLDAYGAAVIITLAASTSVTRVFEVAADSVRGVPASANGNYDMIVTWYR